MIKSLLPFLILFFVLPNQIYAQQNFFLGKVIDNETNSPIDNSSVIFYKGNSIIYQTTSDSIGIFALPAFYLKKADSLKIHALNYDDVKFKKKAESNNQFGLGTFSLTPRKLRLKEIVIKSSNRYRDTTKIDLSEKKFDRGIMINDIFSTNGFYKDIKGQLYYKGKPVSEVVVNGGEFFGKNNMDIYHLLPALVINNIEVVETNIDSLTNTTILRPSIKINLKLKDKYNNGTFGNSNVGLGTFKRYLAGTDLYTYKKREQISFGLNTNNLNISDIPVGEPTVSFSANGNNLTTQKGRFSYNNDLSKKIDISLSAKVKAENKDDLSEVERKEESIDQFSRITNKSNSKLLSLSDAKLTLKYKVNLLSTLTFTQTNSYNKTDHSDLSNYNISLNGLDNISNVNRIQKVVNNGSATELSYVKRFVKPGRQLSITLNKNTINVKNYEVDSVYNFSNQYSKSYFISGNRNSDQNTYLISTSLTEPLGTQAYINFFFQYKNDKINYQPDIVSDSLKSISKIPLTVLNQYIKTGISLQKTFKKISVRGSVAGLIDLRNNLVIGNSNHLVFFNTDADVKVDYKINDRQGYILNYTMVTNYPEAGQLINVNSSFDLISQTTGNLDIKPEVKNSIKFEYTFRKSNLETLNFNANFDLYDGKFGQAINFSPNTPQTIYDANISNAKAAGLGLSFLKHISDKFYFNYNSSISYLEQPTLINNKINFNNGITINQTLTTSQELLKNRLSVSPVFAITYSKYFYEMSSVNMATLTYSDKFSLTLAKFQFDLYPLVNYSHGIDSSTSFSMNGAVKKNFFNGYGDLWLQGYDLFNSFKFNNNFIGSSYTQTIKYSNLHRYILIGMSYKFNSMK